MIINGKDLLMKLIDKDAVLATISEDYISFETAKLLKEKGFNERLLTFYITDEAKKKGSFQLMAFTDDKIDNNHSDRCYLAPTLQMAMKWLREVHEFHIILRISRNTFLYGFKVVDNKGNVPYVNNFVFETYEQACEAAIKYCLENLI